jgi:signal peptidase II
VPLFASAAGTFVLGLLSAWIVRAFLARPVRVLGDWFVLRHAENPGIAFGVRIPSPWQELLILGALALVAGIAWRSQTVLARFAFGSIIGGALANVADRFGDGMVTDYVAVGTFPVFNVPDACISVGVALLLAESLGVGRIMQRKSDTRLRDPRA